MRPLRSSRANVTAVKAVLEKPTIKYVADDKQSTRAKAASTLGALFGLCSPCLLLVRAQQVYYCMAVLHVALHTF